jgi:hypothetical protein
LLGRTREVGDIRFQIGPDRRVRSGVDRGGAAGHDLEGGIRLDGALPTFTPIRADLERNALDSGEPIVDNDTFWAENRRRPLT